MISGRARKTYATVAFLSSGRSEYLQSSDKVELTYLRSGKLRAVQQGFCASVFRSLTACKPAGA